MGTRGFITFVTGGEEKTAYNHWDSYPEGLGVKVLKFLTASLDSVSALKERALALRVVSPDSKPSPEDIARLGKFADTGVGTQSLDDWYVLLRQTQGEPALMLEAGVIEDAGYFPRDSLFAEWGYVIDLDKEAFEVYRGFQKAPHQDGRFADREVFEHTAVGTYYPVRLAGSWPFSALPQEPEFLSALDEPEDEEG